MDNSKLIEKTIKTHERLFYKMAYSYTRNHEDSQDVLHNAYEKAYINKEQIKEKRKAKNWILTIIRHEATRMLTRNSIGREKEQKEFNGRVLEDYSDSIAVKVDITKALQQLKNEQRDLVVMKYFLGYKQKEIAELLGLPLGTVKSKTSRALNELKNILGGDF